MLERDANNPAANYNELILDAPYWASHLPDAVEAVIHGDSANAVGWYEDFRRAYPDSPAPLLRYQPGLADPFRLVQDPLSSVSTTRGGGATAAYENANADGGAAASRRPAGGSGDISRLGYG